MQTLKTITILVRLSLLAFCSLAGCGTGQSQSGENIRLHPQNGHYFEFRGKPVVLMGSTEQYASLMNLDFDFIRYLDEVRACGLNLTRVFTGAYRHYPGFMVEDTPLNVSQERFIAPWARSNVPGASAGGNKFDLTQWDPAYFHRLHQFVSAAGERGIVVEITLFCPFYSVILTGDKERLWNVSPMKASNHINGVGAGNGDSCYQVNSNLLPFHKALARKFTEELQSYDNIIYEVANEPYYGMGPGWENQIIGELVAAEAALPKKHLIAQNIANFQQVITSPHSAVSIFNFHYAYPNAALSNMGLNRVIGNDETGAEGTGDLAYREEAWQFMMSGGGLEDHLDFSFTTTREDGIAAPKEQGGGGPAIRRQLGMLRWFLEELPLVRCSPKTSFITGGIPSGGSAFVLGSAGEAYGLYLRGGTQANLIANLPAGTYRGRWIDPRSGLATASVADFTHAGGSRTLTSPAYGEDVALLLFGGASPPPEVTMGGLVYQTVAAFDSQIDLTANVALVNGSVDRVEFLGNDQILGTDTTSPYTLALGVMPEGKWNIRARAVTTDGRTSVSRPVKCELMGAYQSGVNLNGAGVTLNGDAWTSAANATATGTVLTNFQNSTANPGLSLYPEPDPLTLELLSNRIVRVSTSQQMTVAYPLPNGTYDVFICLTEEAVGFSRDVNVLLEGTVVAQGIGDLAAREWVNYGPYRTVIADGVLNIALQHDTKGNPMIAHFSAYHAEPQPPLAEAQLTLETASGLALLSWPSNVPAANVQTTTDLGNPASWLPLSQPAADFGALMECAVPMTGPRRFFRIRTN
jgi:hypothetical protein